MNSITHKGRIIISLLVCLVIVSFLFLVGKVSGEAKKLALRNATDCLMPLIELATESGGNYGGSHIEAMKSHAEMIQDYVNHMKERNRDLPFLLRLTSFSGRKIVKGLEQVAEELSKGADSKDEARKKIEQAAESMVQFLIELELFAKQPTTGFEAELMSNGIGEALKKSLKDAHDAAERYAKDPNVPNAEQACMTNREGIVYLYMARFGYEEIIDEEDLRTFHADINRAIYYNGLLLQHPAVQSGKDRPDSNYELLSKHTDSEVRRLRLLQTIIDNDIEQTQALLRIAIKKAFPAIQF